MCEPIIRIYSAGLESTLTEASSMHLFIIYTKKHNDYNTYQWYYHAEEQKTFKNLSYCVQKERTDAECSIIRSVVGG